MAIQTKHHVLSEANSLQQRLLATQNTIQQLAPQEQIEQASALSGEANLLTQLQQRVQASFFREQDAIPEASEEDLLAISKKLSAASDILDTIQENYEIAIDLLEIAKEVRSVFEGANLGNITPQQTQLPNGRLIDLTLRSQINTGNRDAVERLQAMILSYQQPGHQADAIQTPVSDGALIEKQNEAFEVNRHLDQLASLYGSLKQVPKDDFETVLKFYVEVKKACSSKLPENKAKLEMLLQKVEALLHTIIGQQKDLEARENPAPAPQGLRAMDNRAVNIATLLELKLALDDACREPSNSDGEKKIQGIFSKTSPQEREQILGAVNAINSERKQRSIPPTLLNQPCTIWGDYTLLQLALQRVLSSIAQATGSPSLIKLKQELQSGKGAVEKMQEVLKAFSELSKEEKERLFKALGEVLIAEKVRKDPLPANLVNQQFNLWPGSFPVKLKAIEKLLIPPAPVPVAAPANKKISEDMIALLAKAKAQPAAPAVKSVRPNAPSGTQFRPTRETQEETLTLSSIKYLQEMLNLLGPDASHNDFQLALEKLVILESLGNKVTFQISRNTPALVADRPCFHLYFIHKNESPEKLVSDMQYGNKAMAGVYPTSNEERMRAILRTIVELALEGMEDAINFESIDDMRKLIVALQETLQKFNPKDIPQQPTDPLQALAIAEAWSSLCSGNMSTANGQNGIRMIHQIRGMLKQAWKL